MHRGKRAALPTATALLFGALLGASSGLFGVGTRSASAAEPIAVSAVAPARGDVVRFVTLPGRIEANQQATLYAKVSGYLTALSVDAGDRVRAGQTLGQIEVPELTADLARHEAGLRVAEQELARVSDALAKAPDLVVPQTVDEARARVEIARADVKRTRTLLSYARLSAPFGGIITARFVDPGAFIPAATASSRSGERPDSAAIVTLMDFATVRVQVPVPEREAALVAPGQPFEFTVDVLGPNVHSTRVSRLAYALDPKTQTMRVEASVPNPGLALRPGMFVTARIGLERHDGVWTLPLEAIVVEKAARSIFVEDGGVARKKPIETGFDDGKRVEIVKGIAGGERVLLRAAVPLVDGASVRVEVRP